MDKRIFFKWHMLLQQSSSLRQFLLACNDIVTVDSQSLGGTLWKANPTRAINSSTAQHWLNARAAWDCYNQVWSSLFWPLISSIAQFTSLSWTKAQATCISERTQKLYAQIIHITCHDEVPTLQAETPLEKKNMKLNIIV